MASPSQTQVAQPPLAVTKRLRTPTAKAIASLQDASSKLHRELDELAQQLLELHKCSPWPEPNTPEYYEQKRLEVERARALLRIDENDFKIKSLSVSQQNFWDWWVQFAMLSFFGTVTIHSSGFSWGGSFGVSFVIAFFAITLFRILDGCQRILNILVLNEARKEAAEHNLSVPAARENFEKIRAL